MRELKLSIFRLCGLTLILLVSVSVWVQPLSAEVVKTISGQAVLTEGVEKARKASISDALSEALSRYVYDDMAVNHKFEAQVDAIILKHRNLYIKNFEIQSERTLGELYQIELRVELNRELIEKDLQKIEHSKRLQINKLILEVLPPAAGTDGDATESLTTPVLEPQDLTRNLRQGLTVYGFELDRAETVTPELEAMFIKLMDSDKVGVVRDFKVSWFQGLMDGDMIIVIRPAAVREEQIASLHKSFWHSRADIAFIDMKNNSITRLPPVNSKVISADYVTGMERLTKDLNARIRKSVVNRLLRDYIVPGGQEERLEFKCSGFRKPADFVTFKERLKSLQTVKRVDLAALAAGSITLEVTTLTSASLMVKWLETSAADGLSYKLKVTPLSTAVGTPEKSSATETPVAIPLSYLVQVVYGAPDGI